MPVNGAVTRSRCFLASGSFKTELNAKGNDLFDRSKANFVGVWGFFSPFLVFDILCAVTIICTLLISKFRKKINITVFLPHFQYT